MDHLRSQRWGIPWETQRNSLVGFYGKRRRSRATAQSIELSISRFAGTSDKANHTTRSTTTVITTSYPFSTLPFRKTLLRLFDLRLLRRSLNRFGHRCRVSLTTLLRRRQEIFRPSCFLRIVTPSGWYGVGIALALGWHWDGIGPMALDRWHSDDIGPRKGKREFIVRFLLSNDFSLSLSPSLCVYTRISN